MSVLLSVLAAGCIIAPPGFEGWPNDDDEGSTVDSGEDDPTMGSGLVEFAWQIGAAGCLDSGVETVVATMGSVEQSFDCLDGRGSLQVRAGTYDLLLEGLDTKGLSRYEGSLTEIRVTDGSTQPLGTIRLQARTGDVETTWRFEDGRLCGANGVVEVDLALIQSERILDQVVTDCADGIETIEGVVAGDYELQALATDIDGFVTHRATVAVTVDQGEMAMAELVLVAE